MTLTPQQQADREARIAAREARILAEKLAARKAADNIFSAPIAAAPTIRVLPEPTKVPVGFKVARGSLKVAYGAYQIRRAGGGGAQPTSAITAQGAQGRATILRLAVRGWAGKSDKA